MITADKVRKIMKDNSIGYIKKLEKDIEWKIKERARDGFDYTYYSLYGVPERLLKFIIQDINDNGFNTKIIERESEYKLRISWEEGRE